MSRPPDPTDKTATWDQRYSEPGFAYGTEPNDFLAAKAGRYLPYGGEVLCLAEGEGRNAVFLAHAGFRVTAIDSSVVGLEKAQRLARAHCTDIRTIVADLAHFDLECERWDGIVSIWCHTPRAIRARLHRSVVAALKPGGVLLLEAYTPKQLEYKTGGPTTVDLLMSLTEVREELAGLELLYGEETLRTIYEGNYHQGMSAVLQVLARKP